MLKQGLQRIIGSFQGQMPGPLVIGIGALHGNEPAGVHALEMVFEALARDKKDNPDFQFKGKLIGLIGNAQAFLTRHRYLEQDLNRLWTTDFVQKISSTPLESLESEAWEALELFQLISAECQAFTGGQVVFLDLHTTSADGGIFSIPSDEEGSLQLAKHLGAPAIVGLQQSLKGTLLGFAKSGGFSTRSLPICVAFEAGQHESAYSVSRAAIALTRCLRVIGCIDQETLADFTDAQSLPFLAYAPSVVRFLYAHHIKEEDKFKMRPGYANFQPVMQGEHLADDANGPVLSPKNGLILMPLYQAKGSDGFFIVQ